MSKLLKKKGKLNGSRSKTKVDKVKSQKRLDELTVQLKDQQDVVEEVIEKDPIDDIVKLGRLVKEAKSECKKLHIRWYKYVADHSELNKARLDEAYAAYVAHTKFMDENDELPEYVTKTILIKQGQMLLNKKNEKTQEKAQKLVSDGVIEIDGEEQDVEKLSSAEVFQALKKITQKKSSKKAKGSDEETGKSVKKKPTSVKEACSIFMHESEGARDYFKSVKPASVKTEKDLGLIEQAKKRAQTILTALKELYEAASKNLEKEEEDEDSDQE